MTDQPDGIMVRATVNLTGLRAGEYAVVDPFDPYIVELLESKYLVEDGSVDDG